jgi:hypothetical protein
VRLPDTNYRLPHTRKKEKKQKNKKKRKKGKREDKFKTIALPEAYLPRSWLG